MIELNLPKADLRLKKVGDKTQVFDITRKKFVALTPEEWVRQNVLHYLVNELAYRKSLIKMELAIEYNRMSRRPDILAYRPDGTPYLVVECKAPYVKINESVVDQIAIYNSILKAPFIAITNGLKHYCLAFNESDSEYTVQNAFPHFDQKQ